MSVAELALAATADFTGVIRTFTGAGFGVPTTATPSTGAGTGVSFASNGGSFTLSSGAFVVNHTTRGGWTATATTNAFYTIRTVTNATSHAGSFAGTPGVGPYSGILGSGSTVFVELGVVPLPMVFASLVVPVNVGSPGTNTATGRVLANAVTVSVLATSWTTGMITVSDQTVSAPTATVVSSTIVTGTSNLSANGRGITLVSPFLIRIRGAAIENRAGYASLTLQCTNKVPEPGPLALLVGGAAGFALLGRRCKV